MNSVIGTAIFGVLTVAIMAYILIEGAKASKEKEHNRRNH